jgi:hypothetical protein
MAVLQPDLTMSILSGVTGQVPHWLQIVTIALAPCVGFLGVAVGAGWKNRSDQRLALRSHRQQVYTEFSRLAEKVKAHLGLRTPTVLRASKPDELLRHAQEAKDLFQELSAIVHQVNLVGSRNTAAAVAKFMAYTADGYLTLLLAARTGFDRATWNMITLRGEQATTQFRDAAAADLGVPGRDRRRPGGAENVEERLADFTAKLESWIADDDVSTASPGQGTSTQT